MKTKIFAKILLLLVCFHFPLDILSKTPTWSNIKFENLDEFSKDFKKKHGRNPDELVIFQNFYFAKAKEAHRKGEYQKILDYLPTLRDTNQNLKNKIKEHYGLTIDYLEIDTLKSMGAVKKASVLQKILEEKEKKISDKDMYYMSKVSIQMQLSDNHRFRGNFNKASEQTAKSQSTIKNSLGLDSASVQIFKNMLDSVRASDKSQTGDINEAESILVKSRKEFDKNVGRIINGQDNSSGHDSFWVLASVVNVRILIDSGREKEAVDLVDQVLSFRKNKPNDRLTNDFKALRLEATNQYPRAIQILKKLVESSPKNILYLKRLSNLYIKIGDYSKAKDVINNQLVVSEKHLGSGSLGAINSKIQAAWVSALEGKVEQSALSLKKSITDLESKLGTLNPTYGDVQIKRPLSHFHYNELLDIKISL